VAIDPGQCALAAAEGSAFEAELIERFPSRDQALSDLARSLAAERADGDPNGALLWNGMASTFIDGLLVRHTSKFKDLPGSRWSSKYSTASGTASLPISMSTSRLVP